MGAVTDTCSALRVTLGCYVLGALAPGERAAVETHLDGCPDCRAELTRLAGLPGLLSRLRLADVTDPPPAAAAGEPGERAVDRALAGLARSRRTARRRRALAAAALSAVVAGGSITGTVALTSSPDGPAGRLVSAADATTRVWAEVWVTDVPSGAGFTIRLWGVRPGTTCALVAVSEDGSSDTAATWTADYRGAVDVRGTSAIPAGRLVRVVVVSGTGEDLLTVPVRTT
ncbi:MULTISPECIES: zf-HC2 domain-containing protein [unclassified Parafrankia]|uniref:zf-HC2 domain-containing protein n=1 Tax=unclassified Parafrankia TaxID=2994368 RepID=UPI000DA4F36E|nr:MULTISPECIES: zf-HC2 domain-containing protein [unclassified Parafrankia]TCJ31574.1 zf-HC2 domain-containing protein [Parafrankia sp. BMG5.11]SQD99963.1 Putative anti-sigma-L factor RslA [Parafrankia sp. Ea1.12]